MDHPIRQTTFIVTKQHFPHVLETWTQPSGDPRYTIRVPADAFPECTARDREQDNLGPLVNCTSKLSPVIVPGEGTNEDFVNWFDLLAQARRWKYPADYLLIGREVVVAGHVWQNNNPLYRGQFNAALMAVKIGGKLDEDGGLAEHILEVKGWTQ